MHTITLHRWLVTGRDGKRRPTRHLMTEADALATDPTAQRIAGTAEVRQVHAPGEYPGHHQVAARPGPTPAPAHHGTHRAQDRPQSLHTSKPCPRCNLAARQPTQRQRRRASITAAV